MSTTPPAPDVGAEVVRVGLWRVALPLVRAHRAAHGSEAVRELVLVEVQLADGTVGWGECSTLARPTYVAEHTAGAWAVLRDELAPALVAGRPSTVVGHPMATAGIVTAATDALLRRVDRSLATELAALGGTNPVAEVPTTAVVGRGTVEEVLAEVDERRALASMVKCKVGPDRRDRATVAAVRAAWPELALAVDANGTLDAEGARAFDDLGLAYLEQPFGPDELVATAALAGRMGTPIALDESVATPGQLDSAVALGAAKVLNVKPARAGGPHAAATLVGRARNAGLEVFVGGMVESGVGRAAALCLAASPLCSLPTDLGPSAAYLDPDVTEPIVAGADGTVVVPMGPGIGRAPDADRLAAVTTEHLVVAR